jgi:hypothetical protein
MSLPIRSKNRDPGQTKFRDLEIRKDLHLSILKPTHLELKVICMRRNLTVQEVFEEFVNRLVTGTPDMIDLLNDIETKKRAKIAQRVNNIDAESLYDIIQRG